MPRWARASRLRAMTLVALALSVIVGCGGGGAQKGGAGTPPQGTTHAQETPQAPDTTRANPATININGGPKTFIVTCNIELHRKQGTPVTFVNNTDYDVTIQFTGLKKPDANVQELSPFNPDEKAPFTIPAHTALKDKITRGMTTYEAGKTLVFEYKVNGTRPVCYAVGKPHPQSGEPGITVDD